MQASSAPSDSVALLQSVWGPLERGESHDFQPFFDLLAEDAVFKNGAGEVHGKEAIVRFFAGTGDELDFNPFVTPIEYYGAGDRVLQLGYETLTVKETGVTHEGEWVFVYDLRDGLITRLVNIQDLSGVAHHAKEALAKAQAGPAT